MGCPQCQLSPVSPAAVHHLRVPLHRRREESHGMRSEFSQEHTRSDSMGWVGCPSGVLGGSSTPQTPRVPTGEGQPDHERHQCHLCSPGNRGLHRGPQPQRALPLQLRQLRLSRPGKIPLARIPAPGNSPGAFSPALQGCGVLSQIPVGVAVSPLPARPIFSWYLGR